MAIDITKAFHDRELLVWQGRHFAVAALEARPAYAPTVDVHGYGHWHQEPTRMSLDLLEVMIAPPSFPTPPKPEPLLMRWAHIKPKRPWAREAGR